MSDHKFQHRVEFAVYRLLVGLLRSRSHDRVAAWGRRFGRVGLRLPRSRHVALRNLSLVFPEKDEEERQRIVRACFEHHGAFYFELASVGRLDLSEILDRFEIQGREHLDETVAEYGACFLTTGHFGCSELALFPLADLLGGVAAVARPLNNRLIDAEIRATRGRFGIEIIDKSGAAYRMRSAVRRGRSVAVIIDQHIRSQAGIRIPFLGHPAWTSPVLGILSTRSGVPVVPLTCVPGAQDGSYRLLLHEPVRPEGRGKDAEKDLTMRALEPLERAIRERPEYWMWMHRRWRDRPETK